MKSFSTLLFAVLFFGPVSTRAEINSDSVQFLLHKTAQWLLKNKDSLSAQQLFHLHLSEELSGNYLAFSPCKVLQEKTVDEVLYQRAKTEGCLIKNVPVKPKASNVASERLMQKMVQLPGAFGPEEVEHSIRSLIAPPDPSSDEAMYVWRYALQKGMHQTFSRSNDSLLAQLTSRAVKSIENPRNSLQKRLKIHAAALHCGIVSKVGWRWIKNLTDWQLPDGSFAMNTRLKISNTETTVAAYTVLLFAYQQYQASEKENKKGPKPR